MQPRLTVQLAAVLKRNLEWNSRCHILQNVQGLCLSWRRRDRSLRCRDAHVGLASRLAASTQLSCDDLTGLNPQRGAASAASTNI